MTRMAKAKTRVASRMRNELVFGTMIASAASAATTSKILTCWLRIASRSFPSEQPGRLDRQDQRHRRVKSEIRDFRKQGLAEIVRQSDQQRADRGSAEAAHAADDHDRESQRQHLEVEARIDAEEGAADDAAQCRQERTERENQHGDARRVDADAARHLRVYDRGTYRRAHPRLLHRHP